MSRKVFISFLGTSEYKECIYTLDTQRSRVVEFVQSALAELFVKEGGDKYFVFTTEGAIEKNWQGLQNEIQCLKLNIPIENIKIPDGKSVDEIWQIFQAIFDCLENEDELYVDITHSFRSIPLLASALLQYAKFLKKVTVKAIYYGAHDARKNENGIDIAPVFDLTAFSAIQDWSTAAHSFIAFGDAERLTSLTQDTIKPVLKESQGKDAAAASLRQVFKYIPTLCNAIKTNRGLEIIKGENQKQIIDNVQTLEQNLLPVLNPILREIQQSVETIYRGKDDTRNMLAAVEWCIDKQLVQAGVTLLQEGIVTVLLDRTDWRDVIKDRLFASSFLQHYNDFQERNDLEQDEKEKREKIKEQLQQRSEWKPLAEDGLFKRIAELRNNINHAGMSGGSKNFQTELENLYIEVKTVFQL
jgi:CRISPR-associated Csx2 family protein